MTAAAQAIDGAIQELTHARRLVSEVRSKQVRGTDLLATLKSTAYAWFKTHRAAVVARVERLDLGEVDRRYQVVLDSTSRYAAKTTYLDALKYAKKALIDVRSAVLTAPASAAANPIDDLAPDFSPLAGNPEMRDVLTRRWHECIKCVKAQAHLAAIVMMGGLLEALFVARANRLTNKDPLIKAVAAPKDKLTGKTLDYQLWMLDSYIRVGHELKWITDSARQVADVLKDYRNYVHPAKELRHRVALAHNDSAMFWQMTKELVRQLLLSASNV